MAKANTFPATVISNHHPRRHRLPPRRPRRHQLRRQHMLGTDQRSARAATVRDLASISLDVSIDSAWRGSGFFTSAADKTRAGEMANAPRRCGSQYEDAVAALKTAIEDFDAWLYKHAQAQAANVGNRCAQEFAGRRLKPAAAVAQVNKRMRDWNTVAVDLIDLLLG